jgi:hypothetical protein
MGVHEQARIDHEKKIARLQAELAPIEAGILREQSAESEIDREIAKFALKAAQGDRAALKTQRELRVRKDEHHLQAQNVERLAVPIRQLIATEEAEIPHLILAETHERVADGIRELPGMCAELSKLIEPIAQAFGEFRSRISAATSEALVLIARGDPDRIHTLENRARTMLLRGIRAQLCFEFRSVGLEIIDVADFEGKNFQAVVEPVLRSMIAALEVPLHANGLPTPGRANFRTLTNVSGLFGLFLKVGEVVSLPTGDDQVKKLISQGALELVDAPENTEARS